VFDERYVADFDDVAVRGGERNVGEILRRLHAAVGAQREIAQSLLDFAAGNLHVLRLQRGHKLRGGQSNGGQLGGIDDDVDLARTAADDQHLADTVDRFETAAQFLVCEFGNVANRRG